MKQNEGFTLIEMIVVVAIIGLLSSVILTGLNKSRQRARDTRRISHILQIQHELEAYRIENNNYPIDFVTFDGLPGIPKDPLSGNSYGYDGDGNQYVLGACLEQNRPLGVDHFFAPIVSDINNLDSPCNCLVDNVYCVSNPL